MYLKCKIMCGFRCQSYICVFVVMKRGVEETEGVVVLCAVSGAGAIVLHSVLSQGFCL